MGKKPTFKPTPEQRAKAAELQERLRKSPYRQTEEQRETLRRIGEKLGFTRLAEQIQKLKAEGKSVALTRLSEQIRNAETEPATPQEPTPRRPKRGRGGRRPTFTAQQQQWLQKKFSRDLKAAPRLAKRDAAVAHVQKLAKDKYDIDAGRTTLLEQVIRPVLGDQKPINNKDGPDQQ